MKNKLLLVILLGAPVFSEASPYFRPLELANPLWSVGVLFTPDARPVQDGFANVAVLSHSTKDGSLIPEDLQPWVPPESWAVTLGAGGNFQRAVGASGVSVDLVETAQAYLFRGLDAMPWESAQRFGQLLKPAEDPSFRVSAGRVWYTRLIDQGVVLPLNTYKLLPGWYVGGTFQRRFGGP